MANANIGIRTNYKSKNYAKAQKEITTFKNSLGGISKDANRSSTTMKNMAGSFSFLRKAGIIGSFYALANGVKSSITASMDAIEVQNLFNISLRSMRDEAQATIDTLSQLTGLDITNLQEAVGTYSLLARSMGMSAQQAEILSRNSMQLALDLSSAMNVPFEQAMQDLRSGLVGQSETVYKYGLDVTEAGLKAEAMAEGITKSVRNMTQGEKMALRYNAMIRQSAIVQGDFARTIDQPANQLRILQTRLVTLSRNIGNIFMPALQFVLPYLNAFAIVLIKASSAIAKFAGFVNKIDPELSESTTSSEDLADNLGTATTNAKKFKSVLSGIDEINTLDFSDNSSASSSSSGADTGSILGGMTLMDPYAIMGDYDTVANEYADGFINKIKDAFSGFVVPQFDFTNLYTSLDSLKQAIQDIANTSWGGLEWAWNNLLVPLSEYTINALVPAFLESISGALELINSVAEITGPIVNELWEKLFSPVVEEIGKPIIWYLTELGNMFSDLANFMLEHPDIFEPIITSVLALGTVFAGFKIVGFISAFSPIGAIILLIMGIAVAVYEVIKHWEDITSFFSGIWDNIKTTISNAISSIVTSIKDWGKTIIDYWAGVFSNIKTTLSGFVNTIVTYWKNVWDSFKAKGAEAWSAIKNTFSGFATFFYNTFSGAWAKVKQLLSSGGQLFNGIRDGVANVFKTLVNGLISGINLLISSPFKTINNLLNLVRGVSVMGFKPFSFIPYNALPIPKIPKLATGGMLEGGQLFIGGEGGKLETVGTHRGKTTVMPLENTDFVSAIGTAVYGAVTSAMGSGTGGQEVVLKVDRTEIARVVASGINTIARQDGKLPITI